MKTMLTDNVKRLKIILLVLSLGLLHSAVAQPLQLSFADAWELAQSQNPRMRQAKLNVDKAKHKIGEAYASALPSLTASGYYQRNIIIPEMVVEMPPEFGGGKTTLRFQEDNMFDGKVQLTQPIYAAGKVGLALKIAKLYRQVTEEQVQQTESELKLTITRLYFGAVMAQEWQQVAQETYNQMSAHLQQVEDMFQQGTVSEYDLIRSRVQVSNFYPQVISAQTAHKVAFEALRIALDLPKDQEITLTDHLEDYPVDTSAVDDPLGIALQRRSELKQLDLQKRMQTNLLKIEKHGAWWPNLFLVGGYDASAQEPDFAFRDYYWMENLYGGVSLTIPIFDGFKAHHRAQQVQVDLKLLDLQRYQVVRSINLEIIQAQDKLKQALKNVQAQTEGRQLAEKGLHIAEVRYRNGLATQLEVMDAQVALNQAKTNELSAYYDAVTAQAELDKALGKH